MPRKIAVASAVALLTGGLVAGFSYQAIASAGTDATAGSKPVPAASPEMFAALQRDLHLTAEQAKVRMTADAKATRVERTLRSGLGARFGGAWLTPSADQIVVAITDASKAAEVRAAGATPKIVTHSESQLDATKSTLDSKTAGAPASVSGWYVDVATNSVVVLSSPAGLDATKSFVAASGIATNSVRVIASEETPRPLADVRGGDAYFINNSGRCSVGFPVVGGFVSAGHCGQPGSSTAGPNRAAQGTFQASSFPGHDYSWVKVNSDWTPRGVVNRYDGSTIAVRGSQEAAVGAAICRSGSTTGLHCGTVGAKNSTVRYPQGSVSGLTRTDVCAEPGDSGGSWISGDQAQGVTSGGSGNCTSGGTTYFQPVNPILSTYGLRLVTS
ncbi:MAG: Streptogrisin-C [Dactylosporangium sp.]|jgi:streptogrisin C|nr:Streptogrisin-C [Dactylosporangium sp.]